MVDVECIIAHVPYPEDAEPLAASVDNGHNLLHEVETDPSLAKALRDRLIAFLKSQVSASPSASSLPKRTPQHHSSKQDTAVRVCSLPVSKMDECVPGICCWWCTHEFSTPAFYLPHWVVDGTFHVTGHFCSYNCALAYNVSMKDNTVCQRSNLLWILYSSWLGSKNAPPLPAPPREVLKRFGGWMTIEEFREHTAVLGHGVRLMLPPLQSVYYTIESQKCLSATSSYPRPNAYVPLDHESVSRARETLKLKRSVPKKSNYVSLEETMGIIKRPKEVSL